MHTNGHPNGEHSARAGKPETRILYVDDSKFDRDLVRHVLEVENGGFHVTEACSRREFEDLLRADSYDLVLTDFNILGDEGFQVLDTVRAHDVGLPVIIVTGTGSEEIAVEALQRGVTDYVIKTPRHIHRLPRTIEAAIEAKKLEQDRERAEEKLRGRIRQQAVVVELGQRALSGTDLNTVMQEACILVSQTLGLEFCHVLETMPDRTSLFLRAGVGWKNDLVGNVVLCLSERDEGCFPIDSETPIIIKDLDERPCHCQPPLLSNHGITSGMNVQIPGDAGSFGVLGAHTRRRERFTHEDLHFLQAIANVLATAIGRKLSERKLRKSENRYRLLIESARDAVYTTSGPGVLTSLNKAFEQLSGYPAGMWVGKSFAGLIHPEDLGLARHVHDQVMKGERMPRYELRILKADGTYLTGEFAVQPLYEDNEIVGTFGIARDISERKRFERELIESKEKAEEMNRLKSAFLTNLSHEIRTPLTSIIGFASILGGEVSDEHREFIRLIEQSGQRLLATMNSLLDLSMLEAGSIRLNKQSVNLVQEVAERIEIHRAHARQKGVELTLKRPDCEYRVDLDRSCLDRILYNLIGNAVKFTNNGHVRVEIRPRDSQIEICIEDTGVGIEPGFVPHLFEAFKQENMGIDRPFEGTGLGLAVTKKLVDLMNGAIHVESTKGKGSTFSLVLPIDDLSTARTEVPSAPAVAQTTLSVRRILAVEDNPDMLVLVKRFLGPMFEVGTASNEAAALELAGKQQFDLVLMDINLGSARTGLEVLADLRKVPGYDTTPVIAVTAYALPGDREHFLRKGFDGYLGKPFTKRVLRETISNVLSE